MTDFEYKFPAVQPEVFEATKKEIAAIQKDAVPLIPNAVAPSGDEE